jgi:2,3-bisphosphoglycerate-independent phosphoglycerate mutase
VYTACEEAGYILLITADHGNAKQMLNPNTGAPLTAHTTNAVLFIMTGDPEKFKLVLDEDKGVEEEDEGALSDVVPTVLDLLGLDQPEGKSCLWRFRRCLVIADSVLVQR